MNESESLTRTHRTPGSFVIRNSFQPHDISTRLLNHNTMLASGFTNAPVSRLLVIGTVVTSFLATLTDTKYYAWIDIRPHLFDYHQFWRLFTWQLCYTNSTEVLFAAMTLYNLRVIERLWGSRKFAVCPLYYTTVLARRSLTGRSL